jgi:thiosulfate/3-mercaptopyruvate sulfurtransferase
MHRVLKTAGVSVVAFVLVCACARIPTFSKPGVRDLMLVSTDWLWKHHDEVVVLHVARNRDGYEKAHIPGAQFVAWSDLTTTRGGVLNEMPPVEDLVALMRRLGIERDDRVVVYDEGIGIQAARAYVALDYLGMGDRTALLDGGWKKWRADGHPVSTAVPKVAASSFQPQPRPEVLAHLQGVRDLSWAKTQAGGAGAALIDARPEREYTGEEAGDQVKRGGHVPGAANVFSGRNVVSEDNPVLRPTDELRSLYEKAGAQPGDKVVTYCRTGGQASLAYFVAKYLGYDTRLYDGSFSEWSAAEDTPVATGTGP